MGISRGFQGHVCLCGSGGECVVGGGAQSFAGYLRLALCFVWHGALREGFNFYFWTVLLILAKFSFWPGDWALGYHSMRFRHFPNVS